MSRLLGRVRADAEEGLPAVLADLEPTDDPGRVAANGTCRRLVGDRGQPGLLRLGVRRTLSHSTSWHMAAMTSHEPPETNHSRRLVQ